MALQKRVSGDGDGPVSPSGAGGAWATVGKKNKLSTVRGEEDVQVTLTAHECRCVSLFSLTPVYPLLPSFTPSQLPRTSRGSAVEVPSARL